MFFSLIALCPFWMQVQPGKLKIKKLKNYIFPKKIQFIYQKTRKIVENKSFVHEHY